MTYSNQSNRNTAQSAVNTVLAGYPTVTGSATSIASGVTTNGTTGLMLSLYVPDEVSIEALQDALLTAWTAGTRSTVYFSVVKI